MKFRRLAQRSWLYFRTGYSMYLGFLLSTASFFTTTFYLAVQSIPLLKFLHLWQYVLLTSFPIIFVSVFLGYIHYKKIGAYQADADIQIESNPYSYKLQVGWQRKVWFPQMILVLKLLKKNAKLTEEEENEVAKIIRDCEHLAQGKDIRQTNK